MLVDIMSGDTVGLRNQASFERLGEMLCSLQITLIAAAIVK